MAQERRDRVSFPPEASRRVFELLRRAKALAKQYYRLTGRPLGITGEVAEFEAARILGIQLSPVRQAGYDAIRQTPDGKLRLQIKGRCFPADRKSGQRLGTIQLKKNWDAVTLVLLDLDLEVREIWEERRRRIARAPCQAGFRCAQSTRRHDGEPVQTHRKPSLETCLSSSAN